MQTKEGKLSIVLPAYNEEAVIKTAGNVISQLLEKEKIEFEVIFVNDGSRDNTWKAVKELVRENHRIKGISFSRNFGKEAAILSGLSHSTGECCVVMDCDLQHPPQLIPLMYKLWQEGYEVVEGVKKDRGIESQVHKAAANMFYKIISWATQIDMSNASDFKLLDRKAVDALLAMPERHPFFRALSSWVGFKKTTVEFEVQERESGESKWSSWSLIKYAITNITSFSTFPLQMITIFGIICFLFALAIGIQTLYSYFAGGVADGFTAIIILLLLIGSILMIGLGIIGYYLSKIFDEVRQRPRYIIDEIANETNAN